MLRLVGRRPKHADSGRYNFRPDASAPTFRWDRSLAPRYSRHRWTGRVSETTGSPGDPHFPSYVPCEVDLELQYVASGADHEERLCRSLQVGGGGAWVQLRGAWGLGLRRSTRGTAGRSDASTTLLRVSAREVVARS
ncbi:hypothetical protein PG996_009217 [Apiospora saccharicola]|uniref:Uncharacterized protein n=1 Tax=Apiospora saccharicola TaxID=335842 RepID=A0ABR1UKP7_9PEZI